MAPSQSPLTLEELTLLSDESLGQLLDMPDEHLEAMLSPEALPEIQLIRYQIKAAREAERQARQARVAGLAQRLLGEIANRKSLRRSIEDRWLADLRRWNSVYEPKFAAALEERRYGSKIFVPLTRRLCNIVEARLADLLFPTDDRNFVVKNSPSPRLLEQARLAARARQTELPAGPDGQPAAPTPQQQAIGELIEQAKARAEAMQREVDDQLQEANWGAVSREVIHDMVVLGTGIVKGPLVLNRTKKVWQNATDEAGNPIDAVMRCTMVEDLSPVTVRVDPWRFYPDLSASKIKSCSSTYEEHRLTASEMAKLARQKGFDADAIREELRTKPNSVADANADQLRAVSGTMGVPDERYVVYEHHGPLTPEELEACGAKIPDDPLLVIEGVVWFTESGRVLKAIANPMDTGERPYSVVCWQKDFGSIFGFGLPYEVADLQDTGNSAFRAVIDNLGLTVGPQVIVNRKAVQPANGSWTIEPNKIWEAIEKGADVRTAFGLFQIESRVGDLMNVFNGVKSMFDELGGLQLAMQGQEAPSYLQTATGTSIAYNQSNIWMRRAVRSWDDDITSDMLPRFIDWNLQYSDKPEVKGQDLGILARGTSSLLEAEGQVQRIDLLLQRAAGIPMPFKRRIAQLKAMCQAMRVDPAEILPSDEEVERMAPEIDKPQQQENPELERIKLRQAEIEDKVQDRAFQMQVEQLRAQLRTAEIASREQLTREQAEKKYGIDLEKLMSQERVTQVRESMANQRMNAELAAKATMGSGI